MLTAVSAGVAAPGCLSSILLGSLVMSHRQGLGSRGKVLWDLDEIWLVLS